jgi:hypothetical protein
MVGRSVPTERIVFLLKDCAGFENFEKGHTVKYRATGYPEKLALIRRVPATITFRDV